MKLGSLFDGSGGFPLAGVLCGVEPVWAAEVEPYPIAVTRERFPHMRHLGDISKINGADIEPVDVITFGSPCQDLSVAGKRAGLKHEANGDEETTRSGLFMEAVRIIKEMRAATNGVYPRFALWENVPGAFSSNKGEDFRIVCEELIKIIEPAASMPSVPQKGWPYSDSYIGDGWSLAYRVFDAQYWGVPQRRRRIHLVVDFGGECAREVLFERDGVRGYFETSRTPWQAASCNAQDCPGADDSQSEVGERGECGARGRQLDAVSITETVIAIDQQGGKGGANYAVNVMPTMCSDSHGTPHAVAYTLKVRSGCDVDSYGKAAGKGALVQTEKAATLACVQDQYLFQPVIDRHILDDQGGSVINVRTDGKSPTLRAETHGNLPCVMSIENHPADSRVGIDGSGKVQTLTSRMGTGGGNVPMVMEINPVYCLQGNGIDRADTAGCNGKGVKENICYTLNTIDRPAVAYCHKPRLASGRETVGTLMANAGTKMWLGNQEAFSSDYHIIEGQEVHYIVRRLTPTECARLQGFADQHGHLEQKADLTDEEYSFWLGVRNTHAAINDKTVKDYTKAQMLTWYNKLWTDGAEYKMWGNGIALPPALYCMQGIADVLNREEDDSWML